MCSSSGHAREGDVITSQGQSIAVKQVKPGVLSAQRFTFSDSQGDTVAIMDTGGITRGAQLDGDEAELASAPPLPQRSSDDGAPVWSTTFPIDPQAPHVYTECADIWNPIHTERKVALAAGLPDIILHGSANILIALREVINRSLDGDPTRVSVSPVSSGGWSFRVGMSRSVRWRCGTRVIGRLCSTRCATIRVSWRLRMGSWLRARTTISPRSAGGDVA